jgi:hypothetical protein
VKLRKPLLKDSAKELLWM